MRCISVQSDLVEVRYVFVFILFYSGVLFYSVCTPAVTIVLVTDPLESSGVFFFQLRRRGKLHGSRPACSNFVVQSLDTISSCHVLSVKIKERLTLELSMTYSIMSRGKQSNIEPPRPITRYTNPRGGMRRKRAIRVSCSSPKKLSVHHPSNNQTHR